MTGVSATSNETLLALDSGNVRALDAQRRTYACTAVVGTYMLKRLRSNLSP